MGLFDAIKDAFTTDDDERLAAAQKVLAQLQADLQKAKDKNDINAIADIQGKIAAAEGQINDLNLKVGNTTDHNAEATPITSETPVVPERDAEPVAAPAVADPVVAETVVADPVVAAAPAAPAAPAEPAAPEYRTYTVRHGDTLSKIGREYGVTYQAIAKLNGIANPDLIYPGQVFKIPN